MDRVKKCLKDRPLSLWMPVVITNLGGPASFQKKLLSRLEDRGIAVNFGPDGYNRKCLAALIVNGTRHMGTLLKAKRNGTRIIQRLGSPFSSNLHRVIPLPQRLRSWIGNQTMIFIRRYLADIIIYQSEFVKQCWGKKYGKVNAPSLICYNGVDLIHFSPDGPQYVSQAQICIISVEGSQDYPDNSTAFQVTQEVVRRGINAELLIFGKPWKGAFQKYTEFPFVKFIGQVPNQDLPYYYRGASIYVLNDYVNAGCPNSVIEALACGCPVVGYGDGVLQEILTDEAGICTPCIGNPWKGETPGNVPALADAVLCIYQNDKIYRRGARKLAKERFNLDHMVDQYTQVLFDE